MKLINTIKKIFNKEKDNKNIPLINISDRDSSSAKYVKDLFNLTNQIAGKPLIQIISNKESL